MSTHPAKQKVSQAFPNLAANVTDSYAAFRAPYAGTVSRVAYAADADITGAATNNRTLSLVNKGQDGNGAVTVATLTFASGTNASDFDERDITLSGTPANLTVAEGDILAWVSTANGTGIADPGGTAIVEITRGDVSA